MSLIYTAAKTLLTLSAVAVAAQKAPILARHGSDSTSLVFKILQLADLHITGFPTVGCGKKSLPTGMTSQDCSEALTYKFMEQLLDLEKPDFIAFTGDNVQALDPTSHKKAIDAVTKAAETRKIPYGMVFGNHDQEGDFPRDKILEMVSKLSYSYTAGGPEIVDGIGNYMLNVSAPIAGAWGSQNDTVFRMYFLDSGAAALTDKYPYVYSEYDWIKQSQIDYYRHLSETGRSERHRSIESVLPAVMFFHIPLVEFAYSKDSCNGEQHERVHDQGMNLRLLSTLSQMNEVKAAFVGHDHVNEYCCLVSGVQLCYGGGTGFGRSYSAPGFSRRARLIEWTVDSNERHVIRSWKRHYDDISVLHSKEILYSEL
ncbi:purple acid phosphatase 29 isoform 1 [Plasmopara halstedii]|uniref:Purple acid phosphatase 29 isoform 1 n=1 Tax=Plasmopara halstedii TaxID=4781 RepID=A0A0P1AHL9_PLAHL|nr:purple acid phosphatase 29 isoform 1 [Plasmopara halstedii]CEG40721.1 purple acid phosphatase 29 isoform 1 [Plasmopara halstedii]|eukprot:XP_024577090.1 purple acid phosphatase 29 isoform 1 [Plasmopara halstedii]